MTETSLGTVRLQPMHDLSENETKQCATAAHENVKDAGQLVTVV
jgi:hypothetical protein